ncbi:anti sigma factor C-terminal domain-containing protein [Paenibacillus sp. Z6-24]
MSDPFRQKLQDYYDGKLSDEQRAEVEQELNKLEQYQQYVGEQLDRDEQQYMGEQTDLDEQHSTERQVDQNEPLNGNHAQHRDKDHSASAAFPKMKPAFMRRYGQLYTDERMDQKKVRRIMRRSKWRSRSGTAGIVIGAFFAFIFVCSIFNIIYYGIGENGRLDTYRDVIRSAIAVTQPNVSLDSAGANVDPTGLHIKGAMEKQIGSSQVKIADYSVDITFNFARTYNTDWLTESTPSSLPFQPPGSNVSNDSAATWERLEHLPEGTVVEAFISFDKYYSTDQALQLFKGRNMKPLWLAVRPGTDSDMNESGSSMLSNVIGFPYEPLWHNSDQTLLHHSEEKIGWFSRTSSSSYSYPTVQDYGSGDIRDQNFLDTLHLIQPYKGILRAPAPFYDFDRITRYIEQNGVQIYGMAVTGPTKEVLKLKNEAFAHRIELGEVRLWNWED